MPAPSPNLRPSIPIAYLQLLLEILGERGTGVAELLEGQDIGADLIGRPQARMSAWQWTRLVQRALDLSGDPGLGYEYGLRMRPTVHGVLGYAALSSANLRQGLELCVRYFRVRQANFSLHYSDGGERGRGQLVLEECVPIPVLRSFFVENILLGLARATAVLLGRELAELRDLEISFDWPEPDYHAAWRERLPLIRFNQPHNAISLPPAYMDLRPVLADPLATSQAIELCERELALVAGTDADLCGRVLAQLHAETDAGYPQLETVAACLHLSGRSLKRKLQTQGSGFLLLLEQARRRDAEQLLRHDGLSIQLIAERLGYRNPANFSRAFQRWTGVAPSRWRERDHPAPSQAPS